MKFTDLTKGQEQINNREHFKFRKTHKTDVNMLVTFKGQNLIFWLLPFNVELYKLDKEIIIALRAFTRSPTTSRLQSPHGSYTKSYLLRQKRHIFKTENVPFLSLIYQVSRPYKL